MPTERWHAPGPTSLSRRRLLQLSAMTLGAGALVACSSDDDGALTSQSASESEQLGFHPEGRIVGSLPKPDVPFIGTDGQPFDFAAETDGRLTLLFFGYTSCPDQCPVYLNNMAAVMRKLEGRAAATKVVFVGVDTARDTPEVLKTYLASKDSDFIGLTGDPADIDAALASLLLPGVEIPEDTSGNYSVGHATSAVVFTPDNLCHIMYPYDLRQSEWVEELNKLVDFDWSTVSLD